MRYLYETFWRHFWDVGTLVSNNYEFLYVCQYVSWLTSFMKLNKQFWMIYLVETVWRHSRDVGTLLPKAEVSEADS